MKSLKSKTKTTAPAPRPQQPKPKPKPKSKPRAKRAPKLRKIELMQHYIDSRAVLNISYLDPILVRALQLSFGTKTRYQLRYSSILHKLKIPNTRQITYKHTLDTMEAVSLYTHLIHKRRCGGDQMEQLRDIVALIESYPLKLEYKNKKVEEERKEYNRILEERRKQIKGYYVGLRNEMMNNFHHSEDYTKAEVLSKRIFKLAGDLLNLIIIAVKQNSYDQAEIIFEQPYPQKSCPRKFLKQILGEQRYTAKTIDFVRYYRQARIKHSRNTNFIVCHICKKPLMDAYLRCRNKVQKCLNQTYLNSPNIYYRNLVAFDYRYHPGGQLNEKQLINELDYYKYSTTWAQKEEYTCNRFICKECSMNWVILDNVNDLFTFTCSFCSGDCLCPSCNIAQELVQALAYYLHIMTRNYQPLDSYFQLFQLVNLDHNVDVKVSAHARCSFQANSRKCYEQYYEAVLNDFTKINSVMDTMQDQYLQHPYTFKDIKPTISEKMSQARAFINSIKRERDEKPQPKTTSKSLANVRQANNTYINRLEQKLGQDEEDLNIYKEFGIKPKDIKQKLIEGVQISQKAHRYRVPYKTFKPILQQMFYEKDQLEQILKQCKELKTKLTPMQETDFAKVSILKKEIPFDNIDYQLALNVRKESIILEEKDLIINRALRDRIFYDVSNPLNGYRGMKLKRFHPDAEEFCNLLFDSEDSSEDEGEEEGLSSIDIGQVSVASFIENKRQTGELWEIIAKVDDDERSEGSNDEQADSSFLLIGRNKQDQQNNQPQQNPASLPANGPKYSQGPFLRLSFTSGGIQISDVKDEPESSPDSNRQPLNAPGAGRQEQQPVEERKSEGDEERLDEE